MSVDSITIPRWFDRHLHIRDGEMMKTVLPCTLAQRATGAVIMPNLPDPITTIEKAKAYRDRIQALLPEGSDFEPCMTCYLTDHTSPEEVVRGYQEGVWKAVKLYMASQRGEGGTTGSAHGVSNLLGRYKVFEAMEKHNIPLLGHFEAVEEDVDEFEREVVSLSRDLIPLKMTFPSLPVVAEHITDSRTADWVAESPDYYKVYATTTAHHLLINRNAMFWVPGKGRGMNPGHYCLPVAKRERDRQKILGYVTSGNPRFGAGTDSAPHDETAKSRCYGCAAGIFTAPNAVELYATAFEEKNALHNLGQFLSKNLLHLYGMFYGMKESTEVMTIKREKWIVPEKVGPVQVFKGGKELRWKLL